MGASHDIQGRSIAVGIVPVNVGLNTSVWIAIHDIDTLEDVVVSEATDFN